MFERIKRFLKNRKAVTISQVVAVAMALLIFAYLFPVAMDGITGANTTGWDDAVTTIFGTVLAILAIVGVALQFLPKGRK